MAGNQKNQIKSRIEDVLRSKENLSTDPYSKSLEELVEDLKIYQYELEFQNEELQRIQGEVEESRNAYFNLFQYAPVGYVVLNEDLQILEINNSFSSLCMCFDEPSKGMDFRKFIDAGSQDNFHFFWHELLGSGKTQTVEVRLSNPATEPVIVQINGTYQPEYHQIRFSVIDISEKKKTEQQLEKLVAEKDKFFFIIAHDLRNPMNAFLGLTELLSSELVSLSPDEVAETVKILRNSATNLHRLIENLLHWARTQQGTVTFTPAWQLLRPVADETMQLMSDSFKKKEITVTVNIAVNLAIYADRQMLLFVLRNTLMNALKFSHHKGHITLTAQNKNDQEIVITVTDTGIGMEEIILNKLFKINDILSRKGTDGEPGTGLGLILCKEVADKHGGTIRMESKLDMGSKLVITIPNIPENQSLN